MPSSSSGHGAVAGAASMSKRKRANPKAGKRGRGDAGHKMDREMNTPRPGGWAKRVYHG